MSTLEQTRRDLLPCFYRDLDRIERGEDVTHYSDSYLNHLLTCCKAGVSRKQIMISFTKWMHNFNVINPDKDLEYLRGELKEAEEAHATETSERFVEELADVVIYCYGIAQMYCIDFDGVIQQKMNYNLQRNYMKEE